MRFRSRFRRRGRKRSYKRRGRRIKNIFVSRGGVRL